VDSSVTAQETKTRTRQLVPVADVDEYFKDPTWRILRRNGYFCSSPDGSLLTLWAVGHTDVDSLESLLEIFAAVERARLPARRQLVVLRHLKGVSTTAMARFVRYHEQATAYLRGISHEAVVRPQGVAGVLAEGFYRAVHVPADGRVFTDLGGAVAWVGVTDDAWLAAAAAEEAKLVASIRQSPAGLAALWAPRYMKLTLAEAAAALSMSPRTLQRRLQEGQTAFEALRLNAALAHGEELLSTDVDVKFIAYTLGFASPSAFSAAFRRARGVSPEQWRAGGHGGGAS